MRKIRFLIVFSMIMMMSTTSGCGGTTAPSATRNRVFETYDMSVVTTVGHHSYIPLNIECGTTSHVTEILQVLEKFEALHPELEVTSWSLSEEQYTGCRVYGIWVDHKPKNDQNACR